MDRTKAPEYSIIDKIKIPKVEKFQLTNGIEIYQIAAQNQDITQINFVFTVGVFDQDQLLQANSTVKMLPKGTKNHSADEIAEIFDLLGCNFSYSATMHSSFFRISTLNKHLDTLIQLIAEIFSEPIFDNKDFEIYKAQNKQRLTIDLQEVETIARNELEKMIYGKNYPYGWSAVPEDFDKLDIKLLKDFHKKMMTKGKLKIFVTSAVYDDVIKLLEEYFTKIDFSEATETTKKHKISPEEKFKHIEKSDAKQSAIRIGWQLFDRKHPDALDFLVLNAVFGGYYGARLMKNIRQTKGYTYSIYSIVNALKYSGTYEIVSEVNKDNKMQAVEEIKKEINKLRSEYVTDEELDNMRNYMSGSLLRGMDGAFAFSRAFAGLIVYGLDLNFYNQYFERLKNVSKQRILELANKYLDTEKMFTVIVG